MNQHKLAFWLKDISPDDDWFLGEMAFKGIEETTKEVITFAFSVYVNQNHNTINLAQLDCKDILNDEQLVESAYVGKDIVRVFAMKDIPENIWADSDKFQTAIHTTLIKFLDNEVYKSSVKKYTRKNSK